jgi:hypothetical protein
MWGVIFHCLRNFSFLCEGQEFPTCVLVDAAIFSVGSRKWSA